MLLDSFVHLGLIVYSPDLYQFDSTNRMQASMISIYNLLLLQILSPLLYLTVHD